MTYLTSPVTSNMNLGAKKLASQFISSFSIYFIVSIPSIKLIYSSSYINYISLIFLFLAATTHIISENIKIDRTVFLWWSLFSGFLLLSGVLDYGDSSTLFRYIVLIVSIYAVIIIADNDIVPAFGHLIFFWGLAIALWQILIGVPTDRALGQTYLTVSMPIGAAMTYAMISGMRGDLPPAWRLFYAFSVALMLYSMSTLLGRAALLFSALSFFVTIFLFIIFSPLPSKRKLQVLLVSISAIFLSVFAATIFGLRQMDRIINLFGNIGNEPRLEIYQDAMDYIFLSPIIGYGFGSSSKLFEAYPHNIFLELILHGGLLLFFVYMFILFLLFSTFRLAALNLKIIRQYLPLFSLCLFYLLQWNVSFDFATSYIPLSCILLFIISVRSKFSRNTDH